MASLVYIQENQLINAPSINLLPEFAMFNDAFTWNIVSGTATATNIAQFQLEGERCFRVVPDITLGAFVNSGGDQMEVTIAEDGNYIFSIKHKTDFPEGGAQEISVVIYKNGVSTDYTFSALDTDNGQFKTYYQIIPNLIAGDVLDFAFEFGTNDIAGSYKQYFDAPKLEFDSYGFGLPTVFTEPQSQKLQWQARTDIVNTQSLTLATENLFGFAGTSTTNTTNQLLSTVGLITPNKVGTVLIVDYAFTLTTPAGADQYVNISLVVNGVTYRANTVLLVKGAGNDDYISGSWALTVGSDLFNNGAEIFINPTSTCNITDRYLQVIEHSN